MTSLEDPLKRCWSRIISTDTMICSSPRTPNPEGERLSRGQLKRWHLLLTKKKEDVRVNRVGVCVYREKCRRWVANRRAQKASLNFHPPAGTAERTPWTKQEIKPEIPNKLRKEKQREQTQRRAWKKNRNRRMHTRPMGSWELYIS